jgi:hypothetical protein
MVSGAAEAGEGAATANPADMADTATAVTINLIFMGYPFMPEVTMLRMKCLCANRK